MLKFQGTMSENAKFKDFRMEGYMRKFVQKIKIFQKSQYPKRYYILDFQLAILII